jgi:tripartite ATP-independent transporter DctM subunit
MEMVEMQPTLHEAPSSTLWARVVGPGILKLDQILVWLLAVTLVLELIAVVAHVMARSLFGHALLWTDEVTIIAISVLTFIGGAVAYRRGSHTSVNVATGFLSEGARSTLSIVLEILVLIVSIPIANSAWLLVNAQWNQRTQALELPVGLVTLPLFIGMVLIALFSVDRLCRHGWRVLLSTAICVAVVLGLGEQALSIWPVEGDGAMYLMLGFFFAAVLLGLPVGFALMLAAAMYLHVSGSIPFIAVAQNMASSAQHFVLLALPFFLWAGVIMERGGISLRFIRFASALVGHLPGGLLQVVVVATYLVSGISGSKVADIAAVGSVMRDTLVRRGYSPGQIAAVLASSAAMAETVPPSLAMLVIAAITSVSIGALLIAGLLPAAALAVCLMMLIYIQARRGGERSTARAPLKEILRTAAGAFLPLLMPVMLMLGIRFGVATPTEVSGVAVVFGLLLAMVVYRELPLREFINSAIECAVMSGMVLFVLSAAAAFAWTLTIADLPQRLAEALTSIHGGSVLLFMLASIALVILVSCLLEGLPALLIMAPLLMPAAVQLGIDPVHYAIVLLVATAIGVFIPPIGIAFLITCGVAQATVAEGDAPLFYCAGRWADPDRDGAMDNPRVAAPHGWLNGSTAGVHSTVRDASILGH